MGIPKKYTGYDFCQENADIYLEENPDYDVDSKDIVETKRVNIDYAQEYIDKPWRFYLKGNEYVSVK